MQNKDLVESRLKAYIKNDLTFQKMADLLALAEGGETIDDDYFTFDTFGQPISQDGFMAIGDSMEEIDYSLDLFRSLEPFCEAMESYCKSHPEMRRAESCSKFLIQEFGESWWNRHWNEEKLKLHLKKLQQRPSRKTMQDYVKSSEESGILFECLADLHQETYYGVYAPSVIESDDYDSFESEQGCDLLQCLLDTADPKKAFPLMYDFVCGKPVRHKGRLRFAVSNSVIESSQEDVIDLVRNYVKKNLWLEWMDFNFPSCALEFDFDSIILEPLENADEDSVNLRCTFLYTITLQDSPSHLENLDFYKNPARVFNSTKSFTKLVLALFDFPQSLKLVGYGDEAWVLKDFSPETIKKYYIYEKMYGNYSVAEIADAKDDLYEKMKTMAVGGDILFSDADALMATVRKAIHALELYKKAGQKLIALRCKLLKPDFLSSYIMDAIRLDPILFVDSEIKSVAAFARSLMI